ncbi:MAG: C69 family dipeptidase [Chloroflexota bacterium]|nr:C69 family dipeptidase [Chloroflexota bacterium]
MSYAIYVGRQLTADGHAYLAGYGDEPSSHWLELVPRAVHEPGATIEVGATPTAAMPGTRSRIPQVGETARHLRVGYSSYRGLPGPLTNGGLNEHGVAVRDVWSPSHPRLRAMTRPDQTGPTYSDLARIVLERARTAREGVELIGELIAAHGETTYGGNSHLIADDSEAWVVIEFAGSQGLWVAERLGPDAVRVSRPGRIDVLPPDFASRPDFLGSPNLVSFAVDQGWYDPGRGEPFDVNAIYGDGRGRWPGAAWIEDTLTARAAAGDGLTLADVMWAVRTDRLTGDTAGYGQVVPLRPAAGAALRLLWHAPVGPIAAPFTPFFLGVGAIPPEFGPHRYLFAGEADAFVDDSDPEDTLSAVPQRVEGTRSAVAVFKRLLYLLAEHHEMFLPEVTPVWEAFEREQAAGVERVSRIGETLLAAGLENLVVDLVTGHCSTEAIRSLDLGETLAASMDARSRLLFGIRRERGWRGPERIW